MEPCNQQREVILRHYLRRPRGKSPRDTSRLFTTSTAVTSTGLRPLVSTRNYANKRNGQPSTKAKMVSAIRTSARSLRDYILKTKSRTINFAKGQGTPGHRFAPQQTGTNDASIGSRLDNGDIITKNGTQYKRD
ncbi:hypothetical protein TEQG_04130 [Trichophyton equinum CBS 127.97]|uniref:Uncharacterized protein n=1 Tax=Trichophyton equinum (strain ATCC MYA-4606 / CBS 127.97) TaxID=559882 RepID=F2PT94_TRIEC|nr:hypothetical protein TEQG_04130 [Trichophyton equinum CBS 127.97]